MWSDLPADLQCAIIHAIPPCADWPAKYTRVSRSWDVIAVDAPAYVFRLTLPYTPLCVLNSPLCKPWLLAEAERELARLAAASVGCGGGPAGIKHGSRPKTSFYHALILLSDKITDFAPAVQAALTPIIDAFMRVRAGESVPGLDDEYVNMLCGARATSGRINEFHSALIATRGSLLNADSLDSELGLATCEFTYKWRLRAAIHAYIKCGNLSLTVYPRAAYY